MSHFRKGKGSRDDNEPEILTAAQTAGFVSWDDIVSGRAPIEYRGWYQKADKTDGYDLRFFDEHGVFIIEVKNRDGRNRLETSERIMSHVCAAFAIPYFIVWTPEEMVQILNDRMELK